MDYVFVFFNSAQSIYVIYGHDERQSPSLPLLHEPLRGRQENDGPGERRRNSIRAQTAALPLEREPLSGSSGPNTRIGHPMIASAY